MTIPNRDDFAVNEEFSTARLMRKRRPERVPVDAQSIALFRLGEQCNNDCPMCSNSGRPEAFFQETEELLTRVEFLHTAGIKRVVLTGGEPTIHPGFWEIVEALVEKGIAWDINTHGRSFAEPEFAAKAISMGLKRAIVSFHAFESAVSQEISGCSEAGHLETIAGIEALVDSPVRVTLNVVLTRLNLPILQAHLDYCRERFGEDYRIKVVFPSTAGKGGQWEAIQLQYSEVVQGALAARAWSDDVGIPVVFEGFPNCVLGDADREDFSRSGFGETHYLEDVGGRDLYSIRHIEAQFNVYLESCSVCTALQKCLGVSENYLRTIGIEEFVPFVEDALTAPSGTTDEE
jgi:MoaA/NifB/PqqE/SkfB family radical SAM enzyme